MWARDIREHGLPGQLGRLDRGGCVLPRFSRVTQQLRRCADKGGRSHGDREQRREGSRAWAQSSVAQDLRRAGSEQDEQRHEQEAHKARREIQPCQPDEEQRRCSARPENQRRVPHS